MDVLSTIDVVPDRLACVDSRGRDMNRDSIILATIGWISVALRDAPAR